MENKKKTLMVATVVATLAVCATLVVANKENLITNAFAVNQVNEYGCAANCTGEYYPSHLSQLVKANAKLNGVENVRVIAKASAVSTDKAHTFFQDVDYNKTITSLSKDYFISNRLIRVVGTKSGLTDYTTDDIVAFYGEIKTEEVKFGNWSATVVEIKNPTIYKVNDQVNLDLLKPVVYLQ